MVRDFGRPLDADIVINTVEPLREVNKRLVELLRDLRADDWSKPTVHPDRNVKDLATHLLHGSLRRVTSLRDQYPVAANYTQLIGRPEPTTERLAEVTAMIQTGNRRFMDGMKYMSPRIIIEMIEVYDPLFLKLAEGIEPEGLGLGVLWAGENVSCNWFDMAREYTEKWHHQQQIRDAVGASLLNEPNLIGPAIDVFARGLPFAYRALYAPDGTTINIEICDEIVRFCSLRREQQTWSLWEGATSSPSGTICIAADTAWRVWTKGLTKKEAWNRIRTTGNSALAEPLVNFVGIMA
jgi:hypothetical protein